MATTVSTVRILTIITLVLFILGLVTVAVAPLGGIDALVWLFAGLISWTLERLV